MLQFIKNAYAYVYGTFHGSESIIWSRFNMAFGSAWLALQGADLSPIFNNPKYLSCWIIFSNFVNEMARRRNATYDPKTGSLL